MSRHLKHDFVQGNTWMPVENGGVALPAAYDGPVMPGMYIMFQCKAKTPWRAGHSYGIDRWVMRIDTFDGSTGAFKATIVRACESTQDDGDDSDVMSETDEDVEIKTDGTVQIPLESGVLHVGYPPHARGINQVYARIRSDKSYQHDIIQPDEDD
jgi:hypothetical protein